MCVSNFKFAEKPIFISKSEHRDSIYLLFSGDPPNHYDLLIPFSKESAPLSKNLISRNTESEEESFKNNNQNSCIFCNRYFKTKHGLNIHTSKTHKNSKNISATILEQTLNFPNSLVKSNDIIEDSIDQMNLNNILTKIKSETPIIKRIPKGARTCIAEELSKILNDCVSCKNTNS